MENKEALILSLMKEYYPEVDAGPGTPFYEYVVRPMAFLWTRQQEGMDEFEAATTIENYENISQEDFDRAMSRFFAIRKTGSTVTGTVRIVFLSRKDEYISKGLVLEASGDRQYATTTDTYVRSSELPDELYVDVAVESIGVGNTYNAFANEPIDPSAIYGTIAEDISKAYFIQDTTDGGIVESNADFYRRVKNSLSLKNLTTFRGVAATLYERFNILDLVTVGIRDKEMRRDLIEVPDIGIFHRGGLGDVYVRVAPYGTTTGYKTPLGFPYTFRGKSIVSDPDGLMAEWNKLTFPNLDIYTRGSMRESIEGMSPSTNITTLTSNIQPIDSFVQDVDNEAIHSDNLVRQFWPMVVRLYIRFSDPRGAEMVDNVKKWAVNYIESLYGGRFPHVTELVHYLKAMGVYKVYLPMGMTAHYLTETCRMERIGINYDRSPSTSVLRPIKVDALEFAIDADSQMSRRNVYWYTNKDLVTVEVV